MSRITADGRVHWAVSVKKIGAKFQLTCMPSITMEGVPIGATHDTKLGASVSRSKSAVRELALCNTWDWFGTFTFRGEREELATTVKKYTKWVQNRNRSSLQALKYLIIPEQHKDGAWHCHGLISGVLEGEVRLFSSSDNVPRKLWGNYYNWIPYAYKFGFVSLGRVRSPEGVAHYITKYITKDIARSVTDLHAHLYYASNGLERAERIGVFATEGRDISPSRWQHTNQITNVSMSTFDDWESVTEFLAGYEQI